MTQRLSTLASVLASAAVRASTTVMNWCCSVMAEQPKVYHPEAYYMRGPGPRWREKHAQGRDIAV
jgi:phosphohistidine phosphatase SixA